MYGYQRQRVLSALNQAQKELDRAIRATMLAKNNPDSANDPMSYEQRLNASTRNLERARARLHRAKQAWDTLPH